MEQEANIQSADLKGLLNSSASVSCKNVKISYTREFLLSFAELETCKLQPSGLDPQVLRNPPPGHVVEGANALSSFPTKGVIRKDKDGDRSEAFQNIPEWRRPAGSSGGLLSQGSKRVDHGAASFTNNYTSRSGPVRGETSLLRSYYDRSGWQGPGSLGGQGRWEHRSGSSDRERDRLRHDQDALEQDSGRRVHGSDHLNWQGGTPPEHDGLLGSGSDLRSSRSSGGSMFQNARGHSRPHAAGRAHYVNDTHQPLRSSKIGTHSRTEIRDMFNNETFGNDEVSNHERIEEERRRRDSFELMRKEQHKILQEKQKLNLHKQSEQFEWDSGASSDRKNNEKCLGENGEQLEDHHAGILPAEQSISSASVKTISSAVSTSAARPLLPPGFTKEYLEKQASIKSINREVLEAVNAEVVKDDIDAIKSVPSLDGKVHQMEERHPLTSDLSIKKQELQLSGQETVDTGNVKVLLDSDSGYSQLTGGLDNVSNSLKTNIIVSLPELDQDSWNLGLVNSLDTEKVGESETESNSSKERPNSILDRLFGKASADFDKGDIPMPDENEVNGNNKRAPKSSKFARWFHTEDEKPSVHDGSDILSLFSKSEKVALPSTNTEGAVQTDERPNSPLSSIFPLKNSCKVLPMPHGPSLEDVEKVMTATVKPIIQDEMGQFQSRRNQKSDSVILQQNDADKLLNKKDIQSNSSQKPRVVLTCADLEQSIIAEVSENVSSVQHYSEENHSVSEEKLSMNEQNICMDNHASQHLLSLLQKRTNTRAQKSPMMQNHEERYIGPSKEVDDHENSGSAEKNEIPERTSSQTLEFLFGKAFMNELRSADAPVSVKGPSPSKPVCNDFSLEDNRAKSSFAMSLNRQNFHPNSEFEMGTGSLDAFSSSGKMNMDSKIVGLQSKQTSLDHNAYAHDQHLWHSTPNLNNGSQSSIGNTHFEDAKGIGNRNFALFGTGHQGMLNTGDKGDYSTSLNSGLRSDVSETDGLHNEGDSIMSSLFNSGSKKSMFDAVNIPIGHSLGNNDSIDSKLDGRSTLLRRSSSNGSSASLPMLDSQKSDDYNFSEVLRSTLLITKRSGASIDENSRFEDHNTRVHEAGSHRYGGSNASLESRISLNDMMGTSCPPFTNANNQSGGVDQSHFSNSSGIHQLLGLPSHGSNLPQQQLMMPTDIPFSHSLPGPRGRPPPAFFPYHGPGPYDLNGGAAMNAMPNQQINHQPPPQSRQKLFDHGSGLEPQRHSLDGWSEHLPGRPFSQEPSAQILYQLHNGPPNQSVYHSLHPHGFTPNHFLPPVPVPQRGLSSINNFPFIPEQLPHAPHGLPPNYPQQIPGPFIPEIPIHSMQGPPIHLQPSHTSLGTAHNQSLRPHLGSPPQFNVMVDGRQHAGAMSNDGAVLDMLFAKESKRQPVGSLPLNQYSSRNMGYG